MAFSPFRTFRKHQKAFFAGLTIVCMLTFVLAGSMSRGGDFFSWVGSLIGASRDQKVAVLYGKPIYRQEILSLRSQRQVTNQYMDFLSVQAQENLRRYILEATSKLDDSSEIRQIVNNRHWPGEFRKYPDEVRKGYLKQLSENIRILQSIENSLVQNKKEAEAARLEELTDQLRRDIGRVQRIKDKSELYFGGTLRLEDLIDFMIWKHEADRRGIQLTMADVRELINRETGNRSDFKAAGDSLRQRYREMSPETLRAGLADEFRVRIAKAAVLGEDAARSASVAVTPYEFWQFYRDRRTENVIAVLPIPVRQKDFLDQAGQPKEEELKTLFEEGKNTEYNPASEKPGFKVPPRIGVEWVSARADSEHYRKAADTILAAIQATMPLAYEAALNQEYGREMYANRLPSWTEDLNVRLHDSSVNRPENVAALLGQLAAGTQHPQAFAGYLSYAGNAQAREVQDRARIGSSMILAGSTPTPWTPAALAYFGTPKNQFLPLSGIKDQLVKKIKEQMAKDLVARNMDDLWNEIYQHNHQTPEQVIQEQCFYRPESIASAIGTLTTGATQGKPAVTALLSFAAPGLRRESQLGGELGGQMTLAGTLPNPFLAAGMAYREQNRTVEIVRGIIDRAVSRYGLQHGFSEKQRHAYDIESDPGLKPLRGSYEQFHSRPLFGFDKFRWPETFASLFWPKNQLFQQERGLFAPAKWPEMEINLQSPGLQMDDIRLLGRFNQSTWSASDQPFLYWKNEDKPAYVPTFDDAKDKVLAWWKFDKARQLAEKEAKQVMAEAKGKADAERRLKDGSKHSERWFYLSDQYGHDKVAKLVKPLQPFTLSGPALWEPFKFAKTQIEYPPPDLADKLIAMTEPGEVMVFHDHPKTTYYVAALAQHMTPSAGAFSHEYQIGQVEPLLQELEEATHYRRNLEKNLLAQLRREAGREIIDENRSLVEGRGRADEE